VARRGRQQAGAPALAGVATDGDLRFAVLMPTRPGLLDRARGAARRTGSGKDPSPDSGREQKQSTGPDRTVALVEREMARFITRTESVYVSHHYVAKLWRETRIKPHRLGTFKVSRDPAFAEKVADVVGLYLDPPAVPWCFSIDEKTQIQALDRTQPLLADRVPTRPRNALTTTFDMHDEPVRRAERGHRPGVRRVQTHP